MPLRHITERSSWWLRQRVRVRHRHGWLLWALAAGLLVMASGGCSEPSQRHREGWRLSWADDFDGSSLDRSKWTAENESTFGEGNLELACLMDRPENLLVANGLLHVRAARESAPVVCGDNDERFPAGRSYTSAMISTQGKASWREGRFAMRAKLPLTAGASKGLWPAFWMRPSSGPADGEVDAMEAIGTADPQDPEATVVHQTLWYDVQGTHPQQGHLAEVAGGPADGFHTYAVEWRAGYINWYVDGKRTFRRDRSTTSWLDGALDAKFFIRLNLAVGGRFPGAPDAATRFPADMVVDWVKVYTWR
ncbi:glycoside hydrolase family 16 protein [Nocardioides panacis]|uniref:Glycoside hydrolase family 16 protein n=1 Tax=Nocardioides panacis TaxID=2849501 RepID=A0A975Y0E0_9ACTN|nr:glycoside hydrolase family 16 protein [Nocardioides panacis]QWZ08377.1 glycoside hydrolase family 16 protein [Nocardioides panacis]